MVPRSAPTKNQLAPEQEMDSMGETLEHILVNGPFARSVWKVMRKTAQTQTSEEGEVLAAVEAWSWGVHLKATNIQIETSCNNLYRMISGAPNNISWQAFARWDASKQTVIKANFFICDKSFFY
ncbi:hypothetical protein C5167_020598 [Papaver somniferum]|uniref:Uncharacterized protein n=1 Tax=Papaver somniferum TaxID=3469 RepID=A0A4Y7IVK6_PAPSO|nr:hypothetical protein C5167_020598 [Papaver somniferum]